MQIRELTLTKKVERHIEKHEVTREEIADALNEFKYIKRNEMIHDEASKDKDGRGLREST